MYVDLRKILGRIPKWDDLAWDGQHVLAIYQFKAAATQTQKALASALAGIVPLTASRQRRSLIIVACDQEDAVREITAGHLVTANIAIDEVLQAQPLAVLVKLLRDPHTISAVQQRVQAVLNIRTTCAVAAADQAHGGME